VCNNSGPIFLVDGGIYTHPVDATCGTEEWLGIRWMEALGTTVPLVGYSYNPLSPCGPDQAGACASDPNNANWLQFAATGQVRIFLN